MVNSDYAEQGPLEPWAPSLQAVWVQRSRDTGDTQPSYVLAHHPLHPYRAVVDDAGEATLQQVAVDYLVAAFRLLPGLRENERTLQTWVATLRAREDTPTHLTFGWMPVRERPQPEESSRNSDQRPDDRRETSGPVGSRVIGPRDGPHAVVLFATERIGLADYMGSGFGLRIVLRVRPARAGWRVDITGYAASLPYGVYRMAPLRPEPFAPLDGPLRFIRQLLAREVKRELEDAAGLEPGSAIIRSVRCAEPSPGVWQIERRGVGRLRGQGDRNGLPYAFTFVGSDFSAGKLVHRALLAADGAEGDACVFKLDPGSTGASATSRRQRRPTREAAVLHGFRVDETIMTAQVGPLRDGTEAVVLPSPYVRADFPLLGVLQPRPIDLPGDGPPVRSDDASAVQGFRHVRELLQRMKAYGLLPEDYFVTAQPTIHVHYRSGIRPGPGKDGQAVNARVQPQGWADDEVGNRDPGEPPLLQLHLALADLSTRARAAWVRGGPRAPAEPLGLGADARWMWHEFGHVLLMATTGELELRFAHSLGDALAAIVADPEGRADEGNGRWRYATFPWVFLPRRHDRCVLAGWSWSGMQHAALAAVPDRLQPRRKGYASEQILSSTLFRLYRCLGGDTVLAADPAMPDRRERRRASHYTVYLLMQALQVLGDARVVPASSPELFAHALMVADHDATDEWSATYPPGGGEPPYRRIGGTAHKVVRWAFEMQGLFVPPGGDVHAPGAPPSTDVCIPSRRPEVETTLYGDLKVGTGSYEPVSLHWQRDAADPVPDWQAAADALVVDAGGDITVRVANRGDVAAAAVNVSVWWAPWPAGGDPPSWPDAAAWTACPPAVSAPQRVEASSVESFGPFQHVPPAGRYIVLAAATCNEDPSNIDPATGLPCSVIPTPLADLVSTDNNLGLCVVHP